MWCHAFGIQSPFFKKKIVWLGKVHRKTSFSVRSNDTNVAVQTKKLC